MVVDNLVLNGESILDLSSAIGADGRDILWIEIEGWLLSDGFVLTGDAMLSWLVTPPAHSRLAFQIKVGTPTEHSAMAPTTWGSIKRLYQ